jgi:hypothetical protein
MGLLLPPRQLRMKTQRSQVYVFIRGWDRMGWGEYHCLSFASSSLLHQPQYMEVAMTAAVPAAAIEIKLGTEMRIRCFWGLHVIPNVDKLR